MAGIDGAPRHLRVVSSQIELDDISGRVLFPSPAQGPWLPFLRIAETSTSGGGDDPEGHTHREEEVLNYIVEGRVEYEDDVGRRALLGPGSVELLTAREETRHKLMGAIEPTRTRWLSVVVRCVPEMGEPDHRAQVAHGPPPARRGDATLERLLVGPDSPVVSGAGLECVDIEFRKEGRCVCLIGRERRAVAYVFEGSGSVDGQLADAGAGALIDNVTEVSIQARTGTRVLLASAPRRQIETPS
ncbi:MAG: pirin family protein [Thermoplasmata archaeon]